MWTYSDSRLRICGTLLSAGGTRKKIRKIIFSLCPATDRFFIEELELGQAGGALTPLIILFIIIGLIVYDKIKLKKTYRSYIVALIFTLISVSLK